MIKTDCEVIRKLNVGLQVGREHIQTQLIPGQTIDRTVKIVIDHIIS